MILLLLLMFFVGATQLIWAFIQAIATQQHQVRMHFGFYGAGVAVYFLLLWLIIQIFHQDWRTPIFYLHFFGGAAALCAYHIWIVALSVRLRREQDAERMMQEWN